MKHVRDRSVLPRSAGHTTVLAPQSLSNIRSCVGRCSGQSRPSREFAMKLRSRNKTDRRPVDLMGHTAYATDEGALVPWPVMRHFLEGIQEARDQPSALTEEL